MEQKQNSESPADSPAPGDSPGPALVYQDGRKIPPTHPDHGPMHLLPRQEDGSFAAYYYCSKAELYDSEIPRPPPRRQRRDGFTAERQEAFLEEIGGGASGREAARRIGISPTTAYNLYNSPDGAAFRAAWDEAARVTDIVLEDTAFDRAVNGQEEPVYHKGERVGMRVKYDNKLLMQLLRARNPLKYAPLSEIEGWLRHRGIAPPPDVDAALGRLHAAEAEWGRRLPGEAAPAAIADRSGACAQSVRPRLVEGPSSPPEAEVEDRLWTGRTEPPGGDESSAAESPAVSASSTSPGTGQADDPSAASTSSTSSGNEPSAAAPDASTSSTSSGTGQADDSSAASTSSTSSGSGQPDGAPAPAPAPPPAEEIDDSLIYYRPPPRPRLIVPEGY
ncbi:MAG: hypothetical protein QOJ27_543 [Sphingomonadales bacterium]|nr:hypothetical protein [Sphingomonadales bacterium]